MSKATEESDTAALLRWWNAAWAGQPAGTHVRILRVVTEALEAEGLARSGILTTAGKALLRRVDARALAAAKKGGAS